MSKIFRKYLSILLICLVLGVVTSMLATRFTFYKSTHAITCGPTQDCPKSTSNGYKGFPIPVHRTYCEEEICSNIIAYQIAGVSTLWVDAVIYSLLYVLLLSFYRGIKTGLRYAHSRH